MNNPTERDCSKRTTLVQTLNEIDHLLRQCEKRVLAAQSELGTAESELQKVRQRWWRVRKELLDLLPAWAEATAVEQIQALVHDGRAST